MDAEYLAARVDELMPQVRADLEQLVTIPSINFPGYDQSDVQRCAEACAELLAAVGATPELIPSSSGVPTVRADIPGPPGSPTVLLYSHYDVQPAGDASKWHSEPFVAQERDGRLYGRGAADDKSGVVTHIAVLRAFEGSPPVSLRILLEGEEEYGGDFEDWPTTRPGVFADIDAAVICDMGNVEIGQPTFTTQLRGIIEGVVTVNTLEEPRHSGQFGGPAPDALMVLIKLLATLMDDDGNATIEGITGSDWQRCRLPGAGLPRTDGSPTRCPADRHGQHRVAPVLEAVGHRGGSRRARGGYCPECHHPHGTGEDQRAHSGGRRRGTCHAIARRACAQPCAFRRHRRFRARSPGERIRSARGRSRVRGVLGSNAVRLRGPLDPAGHGRRRPFVANLLEAFPDLEALGVGAQDPLARIHAPNESIHLKELRDSIVAEAVFLLNLSQG
jgi:acetylornithine deacetylase/succinyl-diaminopimelate desuccinylase-like protein